MRFLVDAQLPPALARWFGEQGLSASPVRELGLRDSDDGSIMNHAISGDWAVVTKDEDFVALASASITATDRLASHRQLHKQSPHPMARSSAS